ncbi:hypothetical protein ABZ456_23790 [Streptomyces sp. NPDC005776]|uniref:hypothetical protein n=1 Tax=Streptomyces sp. NPDC005776 TaxID=3154676 RepID=UPI0033F0C240
MTLHQQAVSMGAFALHLRELTALLDPGRGWYGVFCRRDPEGMRACLAGTEIPPWDVVESLFTDLASLRGVAFAERTSVRAAGLYAASAAAHDNRPGGRQLLAERLELMLREQANAAERLSAARTGGAGGAADAEAVAWAHDDHARASARCTELRRRLAAVAAPADRRRTEEEPPPGAPKPRGAQRPAGPSPAPVRTPPRRKPRGARFAGLEAEEESSAAAAPVLPMAAALPRGARFGGAEDTPARTRPGADRKAARRAEAAAQDPARHAAPQDPAALLSARATVETLVRLRVQRRSGEAHGVLCEAAGRSPELLPVLAAELHRAGLDADWATLLWEVSSLPPAGLAAAVDALAGAGRPEDCGHLLRQGVARPAAEIADAVLALDRAGRGPQAQALLGAFVRVRTPQDAARVAQSDPHHLVPHLLAAARTVSEARERDVEHALRVAGIG